MILCEYYNLILCHAQCPEKEKPVGKGQNRQVSKVTKALGFQFKWHGEQLELNRIQHRSVVRNELVLQQIFEYNKPTFI